MSEISLGTFMNWSDFSVDASLEGRSGVGPGEDRLAAILGGEVQGQSESFDLQVGSGPFAGKWEVKAPDNSSEIRPGTEGITAFGPINKTLRIALDELSEFLSFPGIGELAQASGSSEIYNQISGFAKTEITKSGKTNIDLILGGEITANRFEAIMRILIATSELIKNMQGELLDITVGDKEFQVTPTNMLKISRLLGISDDESSSTMGDVADAAVALSSLNSNVFKDPEALRTQWAETIDANEVFDLQGVILVTPKGFMMIPKPYGDKIKFSRVTQGKPKFKTPIRGTSGAGVWSESVFPQKRFNGMKQEKLIRKLIREAILLEELTKSDKKEIDKLIKKGIEKDRAEQKKIIQKELEAELKKSLGTSFFRQPGKIRKTIEDVCRQELAKEMKKGSDLEKSVVAVTKKVLSAWHELLYKQQHIIQRVKI